MFGISGKITDPVCKMEIDQQGSKYSLEYKGKKYYFCSEGCQKKFDIDGDKYVGIQKADTGSCCCH